MRSVTQVKSDGNTFCSEVCPASWFVHALEPTRLDAIETAFTFYEVLSTHVYGAIMISEHDTTPPTEEDDAYEEEEKEEEESGKDDKEGEEDVKSISGTWRIGLIISIV